MSDLVTLQETVADLDLGRALEATMSPLGGPTLRLEAAGGTAEVALWGGQVLSWQPAGQGEVLWLSPLARLDTGRPVRGGIPLCWPWFGPHPSDGTLPAHGVVRGLPWRLAGGIAEAGMTEVRLAVTPAGSSGLPAAVPQGLRLELSVRLDRSLTVTLTTTNSGPAEVALTQALHTYFRVGDVGAISVKGLEHIDYLDKVVGGVRTPGHAGPITFAGEVDRIYDRHDGAAIIVDPVLGRQITVRKSGSRSSVVWNPARERALRMGDMGPEGWREFVCVETANAGDDIVALASGASHDLVATLDVASL